ncbi:MAG TPA: phosphoribosylpyrophosphate synthetase [Ignavibacteria bacterium]|nr:phosphoribosylpyrophosphate synthetase [Ignavibacteria bacterium]HMR40250.1 phosphoribosylpyrophosphate synthetase [Ignavibacteria bacterium]
MNTLRETIERFRSKQFIYDFYVKDNLLQCNETNEKFKAADIAIDKTVRYEGESDPGDMSIIFAITAKSGTMGILIDAFGAYSDSRISEFIKKVPLSNSRKLNESSVK